MSLNDIKLAVINADLGTTGSINDQEKAFWNAALVSGGTSVKTATFQPTSGEAIVIDQDNNNLSLNIDSDATTSNTVDITSNLITTGKMLNIESNSVDTNTRQLVFIKNDNPLATGTIPLRIQQDADKDAFSIVQNGDGGLLSLSADAVKTANVMFVTADGLTSGTILNLISNSANTSGRELIFAKNDNVAAINCVVALFEQDAPKEVLRLKQNSTSAGASLIALEGTAAANATGPISTLTTSGATTHHIQVEINGTKAWIAVSTNDPS